MAGLAVLHIQILEQCSNFGALVMNICGMVERYPCLQVHWVAVRSKRLQPICATVALPVSPLMETSKYFEHADTLQSSYTALRGFGAVFLKKCWGGARLTQDTSTDSSLVPPCPQPSPPPPPPGPPCPLVSRQDSGLRFRISSSYLGA